MNKGLNEVVAVTELSDEQLETVTGGEVGAVATALRSHYREVMNIADADGFHGASGANWMYNG